MQRTARLGLAIAAAAAFVSPAVLEAQTAAEPYKVGTFEIRGAPTVGLVLRDSLIIDIRAANGALERNPMYPRCRCRQTCWS